MHGLEARCQENSGASASGISTSDRKPHLPGLLGDYSLPLPGKPIQFARVSSEGTGKVSSSKQSDVESMSSNPSVMLEDTDGGQLSKDDDEDSEFFDALEHSGNVTSSTVTMATEGVTVKDLDSMTSTSVISTSTMQSSGATSDKEDHLPGPERIDRQLSVSY